MHIKTFLLLFLIILLSAFAGCTQAGKAINSPQEGHIPKQPKKKPTPELTPGTYFVQAWALNQRKCPGSKCHIIAVLKRGQEVNAGERKAGWIKVSLPGSQQYGWVAARYLGTEKPPAGARQSNEKMIPAPEPPPPSEELAPADSSPPTVKGGLAN